MSARTAEAQEISGRIPPRYDKAQGRPVVWLFLSVGAILAGTAALYLFNPAQSNFYPVCMFYKTTGLLCPGCGILRATHQLLHGHIQAAFRFNALFISSLPLLGFGCVQTARYKAANRPALAWLSRRLLWAGFAAVVIFGVLRNLPGASHYFLAPL
jgi:hypothetical protein